MSCLHIHWLEVCCEECIHVCTHVVHDTFAAHTLWSTATAVVATTVCTNFWHFLFRHRCFKVTGPPNFGLSMQTLHVYIYHSQWSENNLCSYCHDFLLSGKIGSLSLGLLWECKCIPRTVPCPNCVCCFPVPFAVMVFIALWYKQDDIYTNSARVVGAQ